MGWLDSVLGQSQTGYNQVMQQQLGNAFTWATATSTTDYTLGFYPEASTPAPSPAKPKPANQAWLDDRINEMRVKL